MQHPEKLGVVLLRVLHRFTALAFHFTRFLLPPLIKMLSKY